jgi:hypothetical protein
MPTVTNVSRCTHLAGWTTALLTDPTITVRFDPSDSGVDELAITDYVGRNKHGGRMKKVFPPARFSLTMQCNLGCGATRVVYLHVDQISAGRVRAAQA